MTRPRTFITSFLLLAAGCASATGAGTSGAGEPSGGSVEVVGAAETPDAAPVEEAGDGGETTFASEADAAEPPEPSTDEVSVAAERLRGLDGWLVITLAHFRRGDRQAVVLWPALNAGGRLVDATVVGVCLVESPEGLVEQGRRWAVLDPGPARQALIAALGGEDYEAAPRDSGAPLAELGARLSALGADFAEAVGRGDRPSARRAAEAFARLLSLEGVAFDNGVAQLLYLAANQQARLEVVSTEESGEAATITFNAVRGALRIRTIRATAVPAEGSSGRWVISSYE